jgi:thymidylate kinase
VRSAFLRLAGQDPHRIWVIDASGSPDDVAGRVESVVRRVLPDLLGGPLPRKAAP